MSLVRLYDLENSECGEDMIRNGRMFYMIWGDVEFTKERYVRVAAIIIATIEGNKNSCV